MENYYKLAKRRREEKSTEKNALEKKLVKEEKKPVKEEKRGNRKRKDGRIGKNKKKK